MGVKRQTALQCGDAIDQTRSDWRGNAEKSRTWRDSRGSRDWRDRCKGRGVAVEDAAVDVGIAAVAVAVAAAAAAAAAAVAAVAAAADGGGCDPNGGAGGGVEVIAVVGAPERKKDATVPAK